MIFICKHISIWKSVWSKNPVVSGFQRQIQDLIFEILCSQFQWCISSILQFCNTPVLEIFPLYSLSCFQDQSTVLLCSCKHRNESSVFHIFHRTIMWIQSCRYSKGSRYCNKQDFLWQEASCTGPYASCRCCDHTGTLFLRSGNNCLLDQIPDSGRIISQLLFLSSGKMLLNLSSVFLKNFIIYSWI